MNIKRKGTGESDAQIIISLINNKLEHPDTLLPLPLSHIFLFLYLSFYFSVHPKAINLSNEYSSAALIYSQAHLEEPCLCYSVDGELQEDVFINRLFGISTKIWNSLVFFLKGSDVHDDRGMRHVPYRWF